MLFLYQMIILVCFHCFIFVGVDEIEQSRNNMNNKVVAAHWVYIKS